ncbi:MAG: peptidase [Burkholderiales bacterium PBB1]|nr:MAG: peptidase [Burkholderiales bacterium PBB1]
MSGWLAIMMVSLLTACASSRNHAPVEVRSASSKASVAASNGGASVGDAAGTQSAPDKPGYYTVKPADTLVRIALDNGQNWKDLARWNGLDNPNLIEVGQVLRVAPPGTDPVPAGARPVVTAKAEPKPLETRAASAPVAAGSGAAASAAGASAPNGAASAAPAVVAPAAPAAPAVTQGDDAMAWMWPASGPVTTVFDEVKSKGLAIAGKAGDPVMAAADGRVVYAGSGLRGYGNLVIVKHNATYLTAYAHNQTLLVKEDQAVRRGQKIAEMGSTDAERVQLHFEIRKLGKPIDPAKLLPPR